VEVLRHVDDDGGIAALAGQARASAAPEHGNAVAAAHGQRLQDVVDRPRQHHPDRDLAIIGGVGGVKRSAAVVEAHLARGLPAEVAGQVARAAEGGATPRLLRALRQIISLMRSLSTARMIFSRAGSPRTRASASLRACSTVVLAGMGGS